MPFWSPEGGWREIHPGLGPGPGQAPQAEEEAIAGVPGAVRPTPVSLREEIPWECRRLVIGTGMQGRLPVMDEVRAEAQRRGVELVVCPTAQAVQVLEQDPADTNAILHVTC